MLSAVVLALTLAQASVPIAVLRFAWPTGITARIETELVREGGTSGQPFRFQMSNRMHILPHENGRLVRFDNQETSADIVSLGPLAQSVLHFWIPETVVANDGNRIRIQDAGRTQALLVAAMQPYIQAAQNVPALQAQVAGLTSSDAPMQLLRPEWVTLVGQWVDTTIPVAPVETTEPTMMFPGLVVDGKVRLTATRGPCMRGTSTLECVTFEKTKTLDREILSQVRERLVQASPGAMLAAVEPVEVQELVRVTLETATMLPHEVVIQRQGSRRETTGERRLSKDLERRRSTFVYEAPASR